MMISHTKERLRWIEKELAARGVKDYRFCTQNDDYVCDKNGNLYSICKTMMRSGKEVKQYRILPIHGSVEDGYITYRIKVNGVRKHLRGHRIMLDAWEGNKPGMVINHKDGNKLNNNLENLEWCTIAENNHHAIETKLYDPGALEKRVYVLPKEEWLTVYILHKHCGYSFRSLGRMNRCSRGAIERVYKRMDSVMKRVEKYYECRTVKI